MKKKAPAASCPIENSGEEQHRDAFEMRVKDLSEEDRQAGGGNGGREGAGEQGHFLNEPRWGKSAQYIHITNLLPNG